MAEESKTERKSREYASAHDCVLKKIKLAGENGFPDRMLFIPDYRSQTKRAEIVFIEFKAKGKTPDPLQYSKMEDLRNMGFTAVWTDTFAKFQTIMDKWVMPL